MIADDHAIVRTGLSHVLQPAVDVDVVGVASDGEEAVALAKEREADIVLMDLVMPNVDGAEATRRLAADRPSTRVVILTSFSDRDRIMEALDAGAIGYLLKDAEPEAVLEGVRAAARGESPLAPSRPQRCRQWRARSTCCPTISPQRCATAGTTGLVTTEAGKGKGADDAVRARRADDRAGSERGGQGADDAKAGRQGADDPPGDDRGGKRKDDGPGHT